ncbi:phosphopantetheine-binding protein [Desulfovibrionales bacterium]
MDNRTKLKQALITELDLEDITIDDIVDEAPLFGEGLGLDSLDAIELVVLVQRNFGITMHDQEEARAAFQSFNTLLAYIEKHGK